MKKSITLISAFFAIGAIHAQTCVTVIAKDSITVIDNNVTTKKVASLIKYRPDGLPIEKINLNNVSNAPEKRETFYYNINNANQLDSVVQYLLADNSKTGTGKYYEYDANGKLIKQTNKEAGELDKITTYTYSGSTLTDIASDQFTASNLTFNANNNFATGSITVTGLGGPYTATFTYDDKINVFKGVLGLNDDMFTYFTNNNLVTVSALGQNAIDITYTYDGSGRPLSVIRVEKTGLTTSSSLNSNFSYDCLDKLVGYKDAKIELSKNVSPNPSADGIFNIDEDVKNVIVRNALGQIIKTTDSNKLDLSSEKSGIYYLEIQTKTGLKYSKVLRQ